MFLRELFEAPSKKAVLAFGRLNPPTIGHAKLVDAITAQEGDHYLFLSQTQKPKTDPLDFATKMKFAKQFFPGVNVGHNGVRTPVQALEMMQSLGYTDIIFIAGSDRVDGFQKLFDTYNGQPDKTGKIPFKFNSIKVVSAGERDPDADGAEGMSASKMRAAAAEGNLEAFAQGVPDKKLAQTMYDAVRKGMGVKDEVPANEILGFATKTPKRTTIKKKRPPEEDSVQDKLKKRRAMAAKGNPDAYKTGTVKEGDLVLDKSSLVPYLRDMIADYLDKENDIKKLSSILKMLVGKEIKTRGKRYVITKETVIEACKRKRRG